MAVATGKYAHLNRGTPSGPCTGDKRRQRSGNRSPAPALGALGTNELVMFDTSTVRDLPDEMHLRVGFFRKFPDTNIGGRLTTGSLWKRFKNKLVAWQCDSMEYVHCEVCFDVDVHSPTRGRMRTFVPDVAARGWMPTNHLLPTSTDDSNKYVAYGVMETDRKGNIGRGFCRKRKFDRPNYEYLHMRLPTKQVLAAIKTGEALVDKQYDAAGMMGCASVPAGFSFDRVYCGNMTGLMLAAAGLLDGVNICAVTPEEIHGQLMDHHKMYMFNDASAFQLECFVDGK